MVRKLSGITGPTPTETFVRKFGFVRKLFIVFIGCLQYSSVIYELHKNSKIADVATTVMQEIAFQRSKKSNISCECMPPVPPPL